MEELINDYKKNFLTIKELTAKYHMGQDRVRDILVSNGIKIRTHNETLILKKNPNYSIEEIEEIVIDNYVNKKWGQKKSGEQFDLDGRTVKRILIEHGIELRDFHTSIQVANSIYDRTCQQYYKNKNLFKEENSNMAWLLGFLAADGNISKEGNRIRIELSIVDREILERIKETFKIENPIHERENKRGFKFASLEWSCSEHKKDLEKYGIIPNKTYILKPPILLDQKYYIDYIRGYFDGDGTVNLNKGPSKNRNSLRWGMCGASKEMLQWIVDTLAINFNIPPVNILKDCSHERDFYSFVYSTNSTKKNLQYSLY